MSDGGPASRPGAVRVLKGFPRPRSPEGIETITPAGRVAGRVSAIWRRYLGLAVSADPYLTTVWIHGQSVDVSIYDRDWPESYRY